MATPERNISSRSTNEDVSVGDLVETVKAYAQQETLGPLKGAGQWLGYGAGGAFALGLGFVFLLLGLLRTLQTEWDRSASGALSWLAYVIVLVVTVVLLVVVIKRINTTPLNKEVE